MQEPVTVQPTAAMVAATPSANAAQHFVSPVHVGFAAADVPPIEGGLSSSLFAFALLVDLGNRGGGYASFFLVAPLTLVALCLVQLGKDEDDRPPPALMSRTKGGASP